MAGAVDTRFKTKYDERSLVLAVREVAENCSPTAPTAVSQSAFDAARSAAGHPDLPTARQIATRLKRKWSEVLQLACNPQRSVDRSLGSRARAEEQPWMDEEFCLTALRTVADRLGVETLRPAQYTAERDRLLAADRRRYRHGRSLALPTVGQVEGNCGSWDEALTMAGLGARGETSDRTWEGVSIADVLERCIEKYDVLPTMREIALFARGEGFPLARQSRPFADELRTVRERRKKRGLTTPGAPPPRSARPDFLHPAQQTAALPGEQRLVRKTGWTEEEAVRALVEFLDWLEQHPGRKPTQRAYRDFAVGRSNVPAASSITRHGGHRELLEKAAEVRRSDLRGG